MKVGKSMEISCLSSLTLIDSLKFSLLCLTSNPGSCHKFAANNELDTHKLDSQFPKCAKHSTINHQLIKIQTATAIPPFHMHVSYVHNGHMCTTSHISGNRRCRQAPSTLLSTVKNYPAYLTQSLRSRKSRDALLYRSVAQRRLGALSPARYERQ